MINMIWAMDEDNLIGNGDKIPWHIKEDLLYYKEKTKDQEVIMGDTTYFSLRKYYKDKPFPYKKIYLATIDKNLDINDGINDVVLVYDLDKLLRLLKEHFASLDYWVVGGATIYKLALPYADNLYISFIKGHHEGDRYFPKIDFSEYRLTWCQDTDKVTYTVYEKKK